MQNEPIIVVSGLPRSGTSMMMSMLVAGGIPALTDAIRAASGVWTKKLVLYATVSGDEVIVGRAPLNR